MKLGYSWAQSVIQVNWVRAGHIQDSIPKSQPDLPPLPDSIAVLKLAQQEFLLHTEINLRQ